MAWRAVMRVPDMALLRIPGYPLVNVVLTQVAWLACVLGGARGSSWPGLLAVAIVVAVHLAVSARPDREAPRLALAAALGFALDAALGFSGVCAWVGGADGGRVPPLWLIALWPSFATMLTAALSWLVLRWWLAGLFGFVGGPLAYFAGANLGALTFPNGTAIGLLAVGVVWAVAMILLARAARTQAPAGGTTHA